jgi:hypothetical protein
MFKRQEKFNKWAKTVPGRKETLKAVDRTVGCIYSRSGYKNTGMGEKEIISIVEGKRIETEILL